MTGRAPFTSVLGELPPPPSYCIGCAKITRTNWCMPASFTPHSLLWFDFRLLCAGTACAVQPQTFRFYANHFVYTGLIRRWLGVVRFLVAILLWRRLCGRFAAGDEFSTRVEYCAAGASASKVKFSFQMRLILTAKFGSHTWPFDAIANRTMSFDK